MFVTVFSQAEALYRYYGNQIKITHIFETSWPNLHDDI